MKYAGVLGLSILLFAESAHAVETAGDTAVEIKITAEVEVTVKTADGREEVKRVPAAKVLPGTAVIYTLNAKNTSAAAPSTPPAPRPVKRSTSPMWGNPMAKTSTSPPT